MRMAARASDNKLYVLSHFESKFTVLRLSDLSELATIPLGLSGSTSDTISDLGADPDGTLLAAVVCEQGKVVVIDGATESILGTATLAGILQDGGPGRMCAAVDATNRRVFVYVRDDGKLYRLDESNGFQTSAFVTVGASAEAKAAYSIKSVYYSPTLHKVFSFDKIIDPDTLQVVGSLSGVHRIVAEESGVLYGQVKDSNSDEYLVTLDVATYAIQKSRFLVHTEVMSSYIAFDLAQGRAALSDPSESSVEWFDPR
jgi:DNA-binding beta-propeller fold protein YncE